MTKVSKIYPVIDGHNDALYYIKTSGQAFEKDEKDAQINLPQLRKGRLLACFWACFSLATDRTAAYLETVSSIESYRRLLAAHPDQLAFAKRVADLEGAQREGKTAVFLHIENFQAVDEKLEVLDEVYELGVRSVGLTWNGKNQLGVGAGGDPRAGLTELGKRVVKKMNRLGMVVDLAHLNERGFYDALETSSSPVMVSHGNCFALCPHPRNLKDKQIKALAAAGGLVGVFFSSKFLAAGGQATVATVLHHIEHIVDLVGPDFVGIGSDFGGVLSGLPRGLENIGRIQTIFRKLEERGFQSGDLEKIAFRNFYRVIKEAAG